MFIDVNVVFEGDCALGDNVYIEAGCVIARALTLKRQATVLLLSAKYSVIEAELPHE